MLNSVPNQFPDRDPTGFWTSESDPDWTGLWKNSTGSEMDIQPALITAVKCLNRVFFGYKPDWIKYFDRSTRLGSDLITQRKFWTGLEQGLRMRNFTWNRFPIKNLLIDSLLTPIVIRFQAKFLTCQISDFTPCTHAQSNNNIIIIITMIFYCGRTVHITDTRAQKVFSCTSAHITETVLAHDQHWEEQSSLSSPQLYRHSQKHRKWITMQ